MLESMLYGVFGYWKGYRDESLEGENNTRNLVKKL